MFGLDFNLPTFVTQVDLRRHYTPKDVLVSQLIVGGPGSGKTLSTLSKLVYAAEEHLAAIVSMDRHWHLNREFIKQACDRGLKGLLVIDRYSEFDSVLPVVTCVKSTHPNLLKRAAYDEVTRLSFCELLFSMAGRGGGPEEKSVLAMPSLSQALGWGINVIMHRDEPVSPAELLTLCRLKHYRTKDLVMTCTHDESRYEMLENIQAAWAGKDRILEERFGAFQRLIRQAFTQAFIARCTAKSRLLELGQQKKIVLLDGSNDGSVHPFTARALFRATNLTLANEWMRQFKETGKPIETLLVWEEAAATDIIGPTIEINIAREGRKTGLYPYVLTQDLEFLSPERRKAVLTCTRRHEWYNPMDPDLCMEAAKDVTYSLIDPNEVALEQEFTRQQTVGHRIEKRRGTSISKQDVPGEDGAITTRTTEGQSESEYLVPIIGEVTEKHVQLRSPDDQVKLRLPLLMKQQPGERMIRQDGWVTPAPVQAPLLPDPFPEDEYPGLADKLINKAIAKSQQAPYFVTPPLPLETSCPPQHYKPNGHKNGAKPKKQIAPSLKPPKNTR